MLTHRSPLIQVQSCRLLKVSLIPEAAALSLATAAIAHNRGYLSLSGAVAASAGGFVAILAGWSWAVFLIAWFCTVTLLSLAGKRQKHERTCQTVAKVHARDLFQVLANGGPFFLLALASLVFPEAGKPLSVMAAASLAAAGADTAATEIGTWLGATPISIRTLDRVAPGTSGAITAAGTVASLLAALAFAGLAVLTSLATLPSFPIVAFSAFMGSVIDTILGATLQSQRICNLCGSETEQLKHQCGGSTRHASGLMWMTNDAVNAISAASAALLAAAALYATATASDSFLR